jgi:hypothetical protein
MRVAAFVLSLLLIGPLAGEARAADGSIDSMAETCAQYPDWAGCQEDFPNTLEETCAQYPDWAGCGGDLYSTSDTFSDVEDEDFLSEAADPEEIAEDQERVELQRQDIACANVARLTADRERVEFEIDRLSAEHDRFLLNNPEPGLKGSSNDLEIAGRRETVANLLDEMKAYSDRGDPIPESMDQQLIYFIDEIRRLEPLVREEQKARNFQFNIHDAEVRIAQFDEQIEQVRATCAGQ